MQVSRKDLSIWNNGSRVKVPNVVQNHTVAHEALRWLLQNAWVGWIFGAAIGLAVAFPLTFLDRVRRAKDAGIPAIHEHLKKRQEIKLLCGDARALADLAIQRHFSDAAFLRRLRAQPSYTVLSPYLSDRFRQLLTLETLGEDGRGLLATACLEEIEKLEHFLADTPTPKSRGILHRRAGKAA